MIRINYILIILIIVNLLSCDAKSKKENKTIIGEFYELQNDNIKLFLPSYFDYFSEDDYQKTLNTLPNSFEKELELKRFNHLKFSKGNVYYLKDFASKTLITVKLNEHLKFNKSDSSKLLGILSVPCQENIGLMGGNCKKITAGYSGNYKTQVFKAVYEISVAETKSYNTIYVITSNKKTFSLNIYSDKIENYNKYIEKTVVL